jgi:hypothetical protein
MGNRRLSVWLALLIVGALLPAAGGIVLMRQEAASGSDTGTVRVGSDAGVPPGGSSTVPLEVLSMPAPGVGAITVDVVYDPAVIHPSAWVAGPGWDSVLCNLGLTPSRARCTAVNVTGVSGNSLVASIAFEAVGARGRCSSLEAHLITLADSNGTAMQASTQGGEICVSADSSPASPSPTPPGPEPSPAPTASPLPTAPGSLPASSENVDSVQLARGCNPVVSTWAGETDPALIASSTDPVSAVVAIWKFDQVSAVWLGFSPAAPAHVNDVVRIRFLDVLFACVDNAAVLTRPRA